MKKNRKVIAASLLMVALVAIGAVSVFSKTDERVFCSDQLTEEQRESLREKMQELKECFELVLPVTFVMPDGSTINVEDRDGYAELKAWYQDHPDAKERPALQYPVDISYGEGRIVTINNDEEMARAKAACRDEDEPRDGWEELAELLDLSREQLESIRLARAELHSAAREIERQLAASEITRDEAAAALEALRGGFVAHLSGPTPATPKKIAAKA